MKLISWNVNGLRACIQKGFLEQFDQLGADFFCLQETKLQPGQLQLSLPGYQQYWCYAEKKGYSGTAIFTKHTPLSVQYGIGAQGMDNEGRVITLEYQEFYLVTCYTPNAQRGLARLSYRMDWDEAFRSYLSALDAKKPVILCGDLNVAHQEIDLKNPKSNRGSAGFSDEERESFTKTLELGFTDTFRYLNPDAAGVYSWWSYMYHARENNAGWRIDYFLVSDRLREKVFKAPIYTDILGSDHCPVGLEIDLLCNGSLWTPDVAVKKSRDITPAPKKKTGKNVLTLLLLLCVLTMGIFIGSHFFPGENTLQPTDAMQSSDNTESSGLPAPPAPRYLSVTAYDAPMHWESSEHLNLGYLFSEEERYYVMYSTQEIDPAVDKITANTAAPAEREANFWIRLDLTELGLSEYHQYHSPSCEVLSGDVGRLAVDSYFRTYNYEFDGVQGLQDFGGWFVIGSSSGPVTLKITLDEDIQIVTVEQQERMESPEYFTVSVDNFITADQWSNGSYGEHIWAYFHDTQNEISYQLSKPLNQNWPTRDASFMIRIDLTGLGRQYYALSRQNPQVTARSSPSVAGVLQSYYLFTDSYQKSVLGWVYYGWSRTPVYYNVSFCNQSSLCVVEPVFTENDLATSVYYDDDPLTSFDWDSNSDAYITLGGHLFRLGEDLRPGDRENANCWVVLSMTATGLNNYSQNKIPHASLLLELSSDTADALGMCPYYLDGNTATECGIAGWIVYLHIERPEYMVIGYDTEYMLTLGTTDSAPALDG